jgi:ADP-heptose:LPS heptosyltransferase
MAVQTPSFRAAAAVLANAVAFVGTEGGLHHAAAALGRPAVVLFSEFISPAITGYRTHRNLYHAGQPCGSRSACSGCRASMEAISVDEVVSNLLEIV